MRLGIDVGGTKIEGIALAGRADSGLRPGAVLARRRIATPAGDYPATVRAIASLVSAIEAETTRRGTVGVGIPGAVSPATGLVKNANSTCLIGHSIDRDLEEALGRPVRIDNDANCFALSEAVDGAAAGASCVFGVIMGTGVGGGIAIDGRTVPGRMRIAGEWGHNPLASPRAERPWSEIPGPLCYCGRTGCTESWISGPALAADHARTTGQALDPPAIAAAARSGDAGAAATMARHADRLARALATVVNVLDPDVIVIGGGLSNLDLVFDGIAERLAPRVFTDRFDTPILRPLHGDSSGVRGAAWLWPDEPHSASARAAARPAARGTDGGRRAGASSPERETDHAEPDALGG
ncbi:MAG: ROK family protein [Alphaproteobacteria bacterium]|nr:ROK family protein [Alphaproteobacteria bacterium]